jgi:anti-sigma regulatory factor (Ser/Thr protein kinase)
MDTMTQIRPIVQRPRRVALTAGPAAAGEARSHVRAAIHAWHVPIDPYVAVLLTSELVTNAIKHKADDNDTVLLVITWAEDQMRIEVHDASRFEPLLVDAPPDAETGRGLMLVDSLSAEWGFRKTAAGKAVYFTLAPQGDLDEGDDRNAQGDRNPHGGRSTQSGRKPQDARRSLARVAASCGRLWY